MLNRAAVGAAALLLAAAVAVAVATALAFTRASASAASAASPSASAGAVAVATGTSNLNSASASPNASPASSSSAPSASSTAGSSLPSANVAVQTVSTADSQNAEAVATSSLPTAVGTQSLKCNGLAEACVLPFSSMSFVGAHNAGGSSFQCLAYVAADGSSANTCNDASVLPVNCTFDNQQYDLADLLDMGVRWLDMAFVGYNPVDPTQAYTAHNSDSTEFGIAYGESASSVFATIGSFLAQNRDELLVLWLKPGETDSYIVRPDGQNGYNAFFNSLRNSAAGQFLYGTPDVSSSGSFEWPTVGTLINSNKRLVVMGWKTIPSDVGISDTTWIIDSWNSGNSVSDLSSEEKQSCNQGKPVVLEEILPYDGVCVSSRTTSEVDPAYPGILSGCESEGASVMTLLLDYIEPSAQAFSLINAHIQAKAAAL
ncbi:hypothetical protein HDU83_005357 [Entophlyctis luteolus]|nr:hypothetical protein HDU83_005357 [Entophlyctis luteolus]KAJ3387008.1 hypothetical protein HDU84_001101 [Entophlyctis sp. JEL0112]